MRPMPLITLASLNRGKQEEFQTLFSKHNIKMATLDRFVRNFTFLEKVESQERHATYEGNASRKCQAAFLAAKVPMVADDSGIEIEALGGQPGVLSSSFAKPNARENQNEANRKKVLESLKGKSNRNAKMKCTLVFMVEGVMLQAEGVCEGVIAEKEIGIGGFGYDSIFIPTGSDGKTFAELTETEKNKLSHRAKAVDKLAELMRERDIQLVRP